MFELLSLGFGRLFLIVEFSEFLVSGLSLGQTCFFLSNLLSVAVRLMLLSNFGAMLLIPHALELFACLADDIVLTLLKLVHVVPQSLILVGAGHRAQRMKQVLLELL